MPVTADMLALATKIKQMSPPDQLRLAAGLMEAEQADIAYSIVERVTTELGATIALREIEEKRRR